MRLKVKCGAYVAVKPKVQCQGAACGDIDFCAIGVFAGKETVATFAEQDAPCELPRAVLSECAGSEKTRDKYIFMHIKKLN
jgi:hypothetical protein